MLEQIKENVYRINKNQYLKINKKGNGEVVAPARDPVTKKLNWNNIFFTGGTVWGLIKVIIIVLLLLFLLWRYSVEMNDCLEMRKHFDPNTGCIADKYFTIRQYRNITIQTDINYENYFIPTEEVDNESIKLSIFSSTEDDEKLFIK